ncbi:hypothetical protein ACQEVC_22260 [Plantactinospora sp. CA-294935]
MLLVAYRDNLAGLRDMLTNKLALALADQPQADPDDLTARFLGWLPDGP